jgi:hypothetical protein
MSLWRTARGEVAGAWRSLRYDLQRRSDADQRSAAGTEPYGVDDLWGDAPDFGDAYDRPPRRLLAVTVFGLLALVGAAGSYLAVVSGLGLLLTDEPAPNTYPLAAEAGPAPVATGRQTPTSRLGYGSSIAPAPAPQAAPRRTKATVSATPKPRPTTSTTVTTPLRTVAPTLSPCRCSPPAPTPTFPGSAGPSGSPSASVSASVSASPSPSASDDGRGDGSYGRGPDHDAQGDPRERPRDHTGY